jgi:putative transposase
MPDEMRRMEALEDENSRLKKIVADLTLDREMLRGLPRSRPMLTARSAEAALDRHHWPA